MFFCWVCMGKTLSLQDPSTLHLASFKLIDPSIPPQKAAEGKMKATL